METGKTEDNEESSNGSYQEDDGSKEIEELHEAGENASTDEIAQNDSMNLGEEQGKDEAAESVDDNDTSAAELSSDDEERGFADDAMVENVKVADILKMKR